MAVDWGILDPSKGYDYQSDIRNLAAVGAQQQQTQANAYALRQQQRRDEIRPAIAARLSQGDYAGAQQQAIGSGDLDTSSAISSLHDQHLAQLDRETEAMGSTAYALSQIKDPAARAQAYQTQALPYLRQQGFGDAELANPDLSDQGLQAYISHAQGVKGIIQQEQFERQSKQTDAQIAHEQAAQDLDERRFQFEQHKPVAAAFGTDLVDPVTGRVVYDGNGGGTAGAIDNTTRTGGWTPVSTNGQQVVSNKIASIVKTLGIDPEQPVSAQQLPSLAQAIAATEGAPGDLNYRNNNPTNIMDGKFAKSLPGYVGKGEGGYAKFATPQAGLNAATTLLQRKQANGQLSVNDIIMGKPADAGDGGAGAGGMSAAAIDLAAREGLAHGGVVPAGYSRNRAAQAAITNRMAEINAGGDVGGLIQQGQTTKSQGSAFQQWNSGKPGSGSASARSLGVAVLHIDALGDAAQALGNGNTPVLNRIANAYSQATGQPAPTNFNAIKRFVTDEVTKAIVGAGGGQGDRDEASNILNNWSSPAQTAGVIRSLHTLMGGQLEGLRQQYQQTTGRNDFERYVLPRAQQVLETATGAPSAPAGWKITKVSG